jgi:hypothetical protein
VTVQIHDNGGTADGGVDTSASQTFTITVTEVNDPPTATNLTLSASSINENGSVTATLTFSDVEANQTHTCTFEWGEGSPEYSAVLAASVTTCSKTHQYLDDGISGTASDSYTITVTVTDNGTTNGTADPKSSALSSSLTVNNVAPVIATLSAPVTPSPKNTAIPFTATFTDVGSLDTHTCTWTWDDGNTSTFAAAGTGNGSCSTTHTYAAAGVYTVHLKVTDDDLGTVEADLTTLVVVYDPDAGFVTGGGWIVTAAGSYPANPSLSGRANFGFVAKYKKGVSTPEGQTEFQFQVGNLNFHSEVYSSLVVSGCKAQYRGTGTINGSGNYDFVLTAYDAAINGCGTTDRFRIKITNGGTVVYDNKLGNSDDVDLANPQNIDNGSIVIHK